MCSGVTFFRIICYKIILNLKNRLVFKVKKSTLVCFLPVNVKNLKYLIRIGRFQKLVNHNRSKEVYRFEKYEYKK